MASRFDLLNANAPIVTNSPWFGTVMKYSMKSAGISRGKDGLIYIEETRY
ncbi:hypothetical protein HMPREF0519_1956 [Lentilactobacillus hilgardii DSM 20176 = ATCC 8290]|uniref:Uncharacterized protein n=1 Tax=Lentilactobacillus hilgardii (strain ATCC 8290 / DSM 20176 / CCUG 30140 / JCM 1155 / KCTC 3500 / NBRC 15886 / NCIMB 8040 / NRRL B-1843 / 9) TaxID=1423757 RepID=C0XL45_LENH9|nr:hypothetical protein HMPREF0519_1956 [Lentilactobacillus hilgardii DSM 20176 = ATCC 8290]